MILIKFLLSSCQINWFSLCKYSIKWWKERVLQLNIMTSYGRLHNHFLRRRRRLNGSFMQNNSLNVHCSNIRSTIFSKRYPFFFERVLYSLHSGKCIMCVSFRLAAFNKSHDSIHKTKIALVRFLFVYFFFLLRLLGCWCAFRFDVSRRENDFSVSLFRNWIVDDNAKRCKTTSRSIQRDFSAIQRIQC